MTEWYVKDLSKLTEVSVQTLHHYDRIGLLKPSVRLSNGYRIYSEKDLLRLQQIIALKFFGFELSQIKSLLVNSAEAIDHFEIQANVLEQKAIALLEARNMLKKAISSVEEDKSIHWKTIIKLIEVYRMTQKLEHSWVKDIFTPEELKQYAEFERGLKSNSDHKATFEKSWANLLKEINDNLDQDPTSLVGISMGEKCMNWLNNVYGRKYAHLRTKKFEKGFGEGKGLEDIGLTPEIVHWLEKALNAYWQDRIYKILNQVGTGVSNDILFNLWEEALGDMYGDDESRKKEIYNIVLADEKVSLEAKEWLKTLM